MIKSKINIFWRNTSGIFRFACLMIFLVTASGCSKISEYANPAEWYNDTKAWITGEDYNPSQPSKVGAHNQRESSGFPRLSSVPQRPKRPPPSSFKRMASGLIADRKSARYSDEKLRAEEERPSRAQASKSVPAGLSRNKQLNRVAVSTSSGSRKEIKKSELKPRSSVIHTRKEIGDFGALRAKTGLDQKRLFDEPLSARKSIPLKAQAVSRKAKSWGDGTVFASADRFAPRFPARPGSVLNSNLVDNTLAAPFFGGLPVAIVYFENNSSVLNNVARSRIRKAYELYKKQAKGAIHVIGHASSRTPNLDLSKHQLANFNISNKRANSVVKELIKLGADPRSILLSGMSDHQPAFLEVMPAGEAGNRRAEIYFDQ